MKKSRSGVGTPPVRDVIRKSIKFLNLGIMAIGSSDPKILHFA
jgi:hypothetical protein